MSLLAAIVQNSYLTIFLHRGLSIFKEFLEFSNFSYIGILHVRPFLEILAFLLRNFMIFVIYLLFEARFQTGLLCLFGFSNVVLDSIGGVFVLSQIYNYLVTITSLSHLWQLMLILVSRYSCMHLYGCFKGVVNQSPIRGVFKQFLPWIYHGRYEVWEHRI